MQQVIQVKQLSKNYPSGHQALAKVDLTINRGEIFALLGPNGAGKTTLISIICGIVKPGSGTVLVDGKDLIKDFRQVRQCIGLVPQELSVSMFETVWDTVTFSRGLFGKAADPAYLEQLLAELSLLDKKDSKIMALSGGMKRRVLIAKALAHQPQVLFLDEPTAGVDVELRRDMWQMIRRLRDSGVTIILTTHYIDEAEEMADRIGIINQGQIVLVDTKQNLMQRLGKKQLTLQLSSALSDIPAALLPYQLELAANNSQLIYHYDAEHQQATIAGLLRQLNELGIEFTDLHTTQSSLEDIFVGLLETKR